jgi:hypothetical protein
MFFQQAEPRKPLIFSNALVLRLAFLRDPRTRSLEIHENHEYFIARSFRPIGMGS